MAADPTEERIEGPTPNGGVHAVAYFLDAAGDPCPRSEAVAIEIHEFDAAGNSIFRTYMQRTRPPESPPTETPDA